MNESQRISEIFFTTRVGYIAGPDELMDSLHGLCRLELRSILDPGRWTLRRLGTAHHRPWPVDCAGPGLEARGWVERLGDTEVTFRVVALEGAQERLDCSIVYAMLARESAALRVVSCSTGSSQRIADVKPARLWGSAR